MEENGDGVFESDELAKLIESMGSGLVVDKDAGAVVAQGFGCTC